MICGEIAATQKLNSRPLETVYFGGGVRVIHAPFAPSPQTLLLSTVRYALLSMLVHRFHSSPPSPSHTLITFARNVTTGYVNPTKLPKAEALLHTYS